jgi:membrane-bound metal-dependent hydrolase YbcI (DUF457 family)
MFIGHFAVAFASRRVAPRTSLALLLIASQLADILWPIFLLLGWEHVRIDPAATRFSPLDLYHFPWSHSLAALLVWATLFAGTYWLITRYRAGAIVLWFGVLSHWVLDWVTHRPDMPLYPGSPRFGLGLWNSVPGTMIVELAMFAAGVWLYARATRARDWIGRYGFPAYVVLLLVLFIGDRFSGPPPDVQSLIWAAIVFMPLLVVLGWWFDAHRRPVLADRKTSLALDRVGSV